MITIELDQDDAEWFVGWLEALLGPLQFDDINPGSIKISGILKAFKQSIEGAENVE